MVEYHRIVLFLFICCELLCMGAAFSTDAFEKKIAPKALKKLHSTEGAVRLVGSNNSFEGMNCMKLDLI